MHSETPLQHHPHTSPIFLTSELPGTGGRIKVRPEDFLVDEIPAYEPSGSGEHIYMLVQKREMSTPDLVGLIAAHFGVPRLAVGYAGLKDKHAITRQVISVHTPGRRIEDFPMIRDERVSVLWADLHANKLRAGHLLGNRFSIRIRDVKFSDAIVAHRVLAKLASVGVPNRFGAQRFGVRANNHLVGACIVRGEFVAAVEHLLAPIGPDEPAFRRLFAERDYEAAGREAPRPGGAEGGVLRVLSELPKGAAVDDRAAKRAVLAIPRHLLMLMVSAWQSEIFNRVLDARIRSGLLGSLVHGDVAMKQENGSVFAIGAAGAADPEIVSRLAAHELSPTGPMWHAKMLRASGTVEAEELWALSGGGGDAGVGVTLEALDRFCTAAPRLIAPSRRALRVTVRDAEVEGGGDEHGPYIRVAFELPRGAYATTVLAEIMKAATGEDDGSPEEDRSDAGAGEQDDSGRQQ